MDLKALQADVLRISDIYAAEHSIDRDRDWALLKLQEELGVSARLRHLCDQYYEEPGNRVWGRIYTCTHNGPFTLQAEEIDAGRFVAPQFIQALNEVEPVTPDGLALLPRLLQA